ncbi:hypothetical protein [Ferroplasma sp.]|uniref:hypothetical protein n=1 Tax=Ferroplasma sp. TaxID=2591003 RepID=UPI002639232A|nr:hypothetical protein [Ferroplasma sp.]
MTEFPKFHCCVNQKEEDYDSGIQIYFMKEYELAELIGRLIEMDEKHSEEYRKMFEFIKSLENYIITGEKANNFNFLESIEGEKGWAMDYYILLNESRASRVAFRACRKTIEVMYYYRVMSRKDGFSERFNPENFRALLLLRDILYKRSCDLMKK